MGNERKQYSAIYKFSNRQDLFTNIRTHILHPQSTLYDEPLLLLVEELREPRNYFSILRAIAAGQTRAARQVRPDNGQRSERRHPSETYREFHGDERLWRACTSWRHRSGSGR